VPVSAPVEEYLPLPTQFFEMNDPLLLNVGGYLKKSGWVNINSQRSSFGSPEEPEIVRELHDLKVGRDRTGQAAFISTPFDDLCDRASTTALWMFCIAVTLLNTSLSVMELWKLL
jgi:hypothetical protein